MNGTDLDALLSRIERSKSPSPSDIEALYEADLSDFLTNEPDPLSVPDRLIRLAVRLSTNNQYGADEVWAVLEAACAVASEARPQLATEPDLVVGMRSPPQVGEFEPEGLVTMHESAILEAAAEVLVREGENSFPIVLATELFGQDAAMSRSSLSVRVDVGNGRSVVTGERPIAMIAMSKARFIDVLGPRARLVERLRPKTPDEVGRILAISGDRAQDSGISMGSLGH